MLWLREMLAAHHLLLSLLHGQAFFVLGMSIIILSWRNARLKIARDLTPLAIFGFCETLLAWEPLLRGSGDAGGSHWLLIVEAIGYAALLSFALQSYTAPERRDERRWALLSALFLVWLLGVGLAIALGLDPAQVYLGGELAARYGMAFPGGLLGAWGLRRQTFQTIGGERLRLVKSHLRVTGLSMGVFGLLGGLVGPPAPFFPANVLNRETFQAVTGIPLSLLLAICGAAITYGIVMSLSAVLNEIESWLEGMEQRQALARDRERIGRELHDGIIQSIYAAGLILEGARHNLKPEVNQPEAAREQLTRAIDGLNQTIRDIRRYIFDLRGEIPGDDLQSGLTRLLKEFHVNTLLETEFNVEGEEPRPLGSERRQHILQITREALTNVARHAQARRVEVHLNYGPSALQLRISDDGVGLAALPINNRGQGMRNIRERTRLIEGSLDIDTAPGRGLTLILTVPY